MWASRCWSWRRATSFFLYLLRLLTVIDTPFKVGQERTDDEDVEAHAAAIEEQLVEVEEAQAAELDADAARPDG